ncbi:MAG: transcription factor S [Candidatus Aenigmatarchaeota archaeon]
MRTCQKCGTVLIPVRKKGKTFLYCRKCEKNYSIDKKEQITIKTKVRKEFEEAVVVTKKDKEKNLPKTNVVCPKCGNQEAYYYVQQTRSADEPPTIFYICTKCNYSWRSY